MASTRTKKKPSRARRSASPREGPRDRAGRAVSLKIPRKPEFVGIVRLALAGLASRLDLSCEEAEDLKLAAAEACIQAIQRGRGAPEIQVDCEVEDDRVEVAVREVGRASPGPPPSPSREDTTGILLIQALMDQVEIQEDPGKGTFVRMVKYRRENSACPDDGIQGH